VTQVDSTFPDPVLGDTTRLALYSDHPDFNGAKFPTRALHGRVVPVAELYATAGRRRRAI
jgi:hypothetical protein